MNPDESGTEGKVMQFPISQKHSIKACTASADDYSNDFVSLEIAQQLEGALNRSKADLARSRERVSDLYSGLVKALSFCYSQDNYGVPGSEFFVCKFCGEESGAGLLNKGVKHEPGCEIGMLENLLDDSTPTTRK